MEINKVYNENNLETMAKMPNNFIDLTVTSPPYNMNLRIKYGKYLTKQIGDGFSSKYKNFDDNLPIDEYYELHFKILKELLRVSKLVFYNIQIVTGSKRAIFKLMGEFSNQLKDIIVWDKINSQPAMASNVMNRRTELILIFDNENGISRQFENANFNRGELDDIWQIKRGIKISKDHGAVFPEELVSKILTNFSNKNDLIYDPFSGTGTTALVCEKLKLNYIASEIDKNYYDFSVKRINDFKSQLNLF